ncbi:MAG: hypothetical protein ABSG68_06390 [Thermoguttaceae bacterium]|jgi:hypothetical protein
MSIRFHCPHCRQLLSIGTRKAGTAIVCPKCGAAQTVPAQSDAALDLPPRAAGKAAYDSSEVLAMIEAPTQSALTEPAAHGPTQPALAEPVAGQGTAQASRAPVPPPPTLQFVPSDMILFPRRTIYVQAILLVILAMLAFVVGYFVGRGNASYEKQVSEEAQIRQRILVEGKLVYNPGTGRIAGDEGSVVIALPSKTFPGHPLSVQGIRPHDSMPAESHDTLRAIRDLGGAYARCSVSGDFSLFVPDAGKYCVLLISRHAMRPKDLEPDEIDVEAMGKYFDEPETLLGPCKYKWTVEEIRLGFNPIEIDFRQDGQK